MKPYEIYWGKDVQWGKNCNYQHCWVIVDIRENNVFGCFPISSECYNEYGFLIQASHAGFRFTGLKHDSYVIYTSIVELEATDFGNRVGELKDELLSDFRNDAGV